MLTGKIRNDIDKLWEKFWTGGITNPLTVIEQISYLMFARMLDMQEDVAERKANRTGKAFDRLFPNTPEGQLLRWKNFRNMSGKELHSHLKQKVYPYFARLGKQSDQADGLGDDGSALQALGHIGEYMQDADLEIKNESVLTSAVEMVNDLPLTQSDVKGDIYEYLLSKLTTAGINGQFRTPRHIIDAMIELVAPATTEIYTLSLLDALPICPPTSSVTRPAAPLASSPAPWNTLTASTPAKPASLPMKTATNITPATCWSRTGSTSTATCSGASTSIPPCCASPA